MSVQIDCIIDIRIGDVGKGSVTSALAQSGRYSHVLRSAGGNNAGHQSYVGDQKVTTHIVPTGAVLGVRSVIGSGCVINEKGFFAELDDLKRVRPDIEQHVKISRAAHVVLDEHIDAEKNETRLGTTRKGIGYAYAAKANRTGIRAEDIPAFRPFLIDMYEEFYHNYPNAEILCEGHQGIGLDINLTEQYPYCTAVPVGPGEVLNNGFPYRSIRKVICVAKAYDTYVGSRSFQDPSDPILKMFAEYGQERGSTTGRLRSCSYLDLTSMIRNINMVGGDELIVKKMDIMRQVGAWKIKIGTEIVDLGSETAFCDKISNAFPNLNVIFSSNPKGI